ncbi:hypothetical protein A9Q81_19120 [Gammaproteobacteria bacterium 42_54_T18]|nr:hypothetical protein A9Q81_19120 [Gammaproteobacteria bacterium 42_54_T18]
MYKQPVSILILLLPLCFAPGFVSAGNGGMDWQPAASETLIRMPAKYIDASIEDNFQKSSLASGIHALDAQIQLEVERMHESYKIVSEMENEQPVNQQAIESRHQFLTAKSNYLGLLHEKQQLSERVLHKKATLYQRVLKKLKKNKADANDPVSMALIEKQKSARARLQGAVERVDNLLSQPLTNMGGALSSSGETPRSTTPNVYKPSKYQREYGENLAKVQQLKHAIQQHSANENPVLDGQSLNREQYIRYLLSHVDSELALLDQERLMLGYMAKLVALDAQALEHEIAYVEPDGEAMAIKAQMRIANTTDMFIGN